MNPVLLRLKEGEKSFGERKLFASASVRLVARERAALLGPNGAGKSTLFRVLAGLETTSPYGLSETLDHGQLERYGRTFYLPQDYRPSPGLVLELAYHATPLYAAEQALREASGDQVCEAWERVRELSFWKGRIGRTLADFGLGRELWGAQSETLSGGEGVRLGLALAFLSGAEVLLLDEPTTHLDLRMRLKLEELVAQYPGAIFVISHDRALIARIATTIYHLEAGVLQRVAGGYSRYLKEKVRIRRTVEKARKEAEKERERLLGSAESLRPIAPASEKKARQRTQLLRRAARVEAPAPLPPERRWGLEIAAEGTPKRVLEAHELRKNFGDREVIKNASLRVFRGDRIALVGANGSGKTTLLNLLLSRETPDSGERTIFPGVSTAYLDQHYHGLEAASPVGPSGRGQGLMGQFVSRFGETRAAAMLGRMGFRPPHWHDPVNSFSGGERARAGLALLSGLRAGLLVLDEPTNHLELELLEALERALQDYPGTLLFVSHDRELVKKVATRFWGLEEGVLVEYPNYLEAEAAMLGKEAIRLSPLGDLEEKVSEPETAVDPENRRMELLCFLDGPGLSNRERARLRAEILAFEEELYQRYAEEFYLPPRYTHHVREHGADVYCERELSFYRFWSGTESIEFERTGDSAAALSEINIPPTPLEKGGPKSASPGKRDNKTTKEGIALLRALPAVWRAAARILFELENVQAIESSQGKITQADYRRWLFHKPQKRRRPKR